MFWNPFIEVFQLFMIPVEIWYVKKIWAQVNEMAKGK